MSSLSPGLILCIGGLLIPLLRGRAQQIYALALPLISAANLFGVGFSGFEHGLFHRVEMMGLALTMTRVDQLSLIFGIVFHIAALLSVLFSLHVDDAKQMASGVVYAGAGIGAVFAGDLITLFVYWELTAFASVFLIWAANNEAANRVAQRYLIIQVSSGVLLIAGAVLRWIDFGNVDFNAMGNLDHPGNVLIFLAFGIKCAFPLLHNWLPDAYPKATATGTVFLSAFTTKLAVYTMARGFAGLDLLMLIGVVMALFPIVFAVVENDLRRVLAYSLNSQLGFMVAAIGIGTEMAINGAVGHAFASTLYKGLLFMSMGAVLHRVGTTEATKLGGLWRSMPVTTVCCIVGAISISAFPLTSGFVTKSLSLTAAASEHLTWVWFGLLVGSVGAVAHTSIKVPFFAFFGRDRGLRVEAAPRNMQAAMVITAALCLLIGCVPGTFYTLLPYPQAVAQPYTGAHVVTQFQLVLFAALAFVLLMRAWGYPEEVEGEYLDTDWVYRRAFPRVWVVAVGHAHAWRSQLLELGMGIVRAVMSGVERTHGPGGTMAKTWAAGRMVMLGKMALGFYLLLYLFLRH